MDAANVVSYNGSFSYDVFSIFTSNFSVNTGGFGLDTCKGSRWVGALPVALHFLVFICIVFPKFQGVDTFIHSSSDCGVESILWLGVGFHFVSSTIFLSDKKLFRVQLLWHNSLIRCLVSSLFIDPLIIRISFTFIGTLGVGCVCVSFSVSVGGDQCVPG